MTEEQLQAIRDLAETAAYVAAGRAINQPRPKGLVRDAMVRARLAFDLPFVDEDEGEE
jgi:O-methyltransferase involved in polyketide biosynthesis